MFIFDEGSDPSLDKDYTDAFPRSKSTTEEFRYTTTNISLSTISNGAPSSSSSSSSKSSKHKKPKKKNKQKGESRSPAMDDFVLVD